MGNLKDSFGKVFDSAKETLEETLKKAEDLKGKVEEKVEAIKDKAGDLK
jgi:uncharacterized protein YjbJ (UPF0337 family)